MRTSILAFFLLACLFCGIFAKKDRVAASSAATAGQFPFVVQVDVDGVLCGGSILSNRFILTAASCIMEPVTMIMVHAGSINPQVTPAQTKNFTSFTKHPQYNNVTEANDFAVIDLGANVLTLDANVAAICLSGTAPTMPGTAMVAGWGAVVEGGAMQTNLMFATVPFVADATCQTVYANLDSASQLCAGTVNGAAAAEACDGDEGGPLFQTVSGVHQLVGVTSYGSQMCGTNPSVFGDVAASGKAFAESTTVMTFDCVVANTTVAAMSMNMSMMMSMNMSMNMSMMMSMNMSMNSSFVARSVSASFVPPAGCDGTFVASEGFECDDNLGCCNRNCHFKRKAVICPPFKRKRNNGCWTLPRCSKAGKCKKSKRKQPKGNAKGRVFCDFKGTGARTGVCTDGDCVKRA